MLYHRACSCRPSATCDGKLAITNSNRNVTFNVVKKKFGNATYQPISKTSENLTFYNSGDLNHLPANQDSAAVQQYPEFPGMRDLCPVSRKPTKLDDILCKSR